MADLVMMIVRDKVIEVAKKALKRGMSASDVMEITELDESTVTQLQEELANE